MVASSARTVRPRATSTQAAALSAVATPTRSRTCVQESSPWAKAAATSGRSASRALTWASDWSSRAERPRREAETLPRIVPDPGEAERVLAPLPDEGASEGAEDVPAQRLLARQAAEVPVEQERALVAHEIP